MKEFGSDFCYVDTYKLGQVHLTDVFHSATLLADGRQCVIVLIRQYAWKRIWMPDYFCYEVIDTIRKQTNIKVMFYEDNPFCEGQVEKLSFKEGDVLLRMNFFGVRGQRSNKNIPCPVIEDHTHDPLGDWALYSDADWCISSIRKILPIPEGGMIWSPKGFQLMDEIATSSENEKIAAIRWEGMKMKAAYLKGEPIDKQKFRTCYTETEKWFNMAKPSVIDRRSKEFVTKLFDINLWQSVKRKNWQLLQSLLNKDYCKILIPERETCTPFSLTLIFDSQVSRDNLRKQLIVSCVYPAILWDIPETASKEARNFSKRMLSIHCDGRYNEENVRQLAKIINYNLKNKGNN